MKCNASHIGRQQFLAAQRLAKSLLKPYIFPIIIRQMGYADVEAAGVVIQ